MSAPWWCHHCEGSGLHDCWEVDCDHGCSWCGGSGENVNYDPDKPETHFPRSPTMPDTAPDLDPKDLFIACEAEFRAIVPLFQSWWSGNRTLRQVIKPAAAHLEVIAEKAGELRPRIAEEGARERWIIAAIVYAAHLVTGRDDLIPVVDDERAVGWLYRVVRSVVDMWRAQREPAPAA